MGAPGQCHRNDGTGNKREARRGAGEYEQATTHPERFASWRRSVPKARGTLLDRLQRRVSGGVAHVGVARKHCVVQSDAFDLSCRAPKLQSAVGDCEIAPGEVTRLEEPNRFDAARPPVIIERREHGLVRRQWRSRPEPAPLRAVRSLRQLNPCALFATVQFGITCVIGLAYAALPDRPYELTPDRNRRGSTWLKSIAPDGSELTIGARYAQPRAAAIVLTGCVRGATAAGVARRQPTLDIPRHARAAYTHRGDGRRQMDRLLDWLNCLVSLAGEQGQLACTEAAPSDAVAANCAWWRDVPGLRALQVSVLPPPIVAAAPPPPAQPPDGSAHQEVLGADVGAISAISSVSTASATRKARSSTASISGASASTRSCSRDDGTSSPSAALRPAQRDATDAVVPDGAPWACWPRHCNRSEAAG